MNAAHSREGHYIVHTPQALLLKHSSKLSRERERMRCRERGRENARGGGRRLKMETHTTRIYLLIQQRCDMKTPLWPCREAATACRDVASLTMCLNNELK